jgi:hypothetical protein
MDHAGLEPEPLSDQQPTAQDLESFTHLILKEMPT